LVLLVIVFINGLLFFFNRETIAGEIQQNWKKILVIEAVGVTFFLAFLLVRLGNPDLWHPYKGGEKPMDFSYLNAVLKSTTFPPYDPWFAGGYINYYYYGFVVVGMPIKALGIDPAVAYNLTLAMLFSLFALVSFSIGSTLFNAVLKPSVDEKDFSFIGGIATAFMGLVIGNFGTIQMIFNGLIRLGGGFEDMAIHERFMALSKGIELKLQGNPWPFYPGDWYWIPSRMIPEEPITEFPFFTFLYADLHAHMIAMPITLLVVAWCISLLQNRLRWDGQFSWWKKVLVLFSGALIVGALRPTNTWDFPVFLVLAILTLAYVLFTEVKYKFQKGLHKFDHRLLTIVTHILFVAVFVLTALLLYSPFTYWYGEGYNSIQLWEGSKTPINSYWGHWGIMLSLIVVWFAMDTYQLLKETPVSALKVVRKIRILIIIGLALALSMLVALQLYGVNVHWLAIPLALWAALMLMQKNIPSVKRFLYFLVGTGLFLTIVVEVIALEGDIGRMNTVFKFYLQAWNLLALVAGMGLSAFIFKLIKGHSSPLQLTTTILLTVFLMCGLLFPVLATTDKINDRMAMDAPHVLDGMAYMDFAEFNDQGVVYSLSEDAAAIRWMQENVDGTPVIVEGHAPEYRWGTRFTIYTGLPSVVGWNWHQRQQRTYLGTNDVQNRVDQVNQFYSTQNVEEAKMLISEYDVEYIIVGQMEEVYYPEEGLMKFAQFEGELWEKVYSNTGTTIYRVIDWE
jgi:YYY domain-containing protein